MAGVPEIRFNAKTGKYEQVQTVEFDAEGARRDLKAVQDELVVQRASIQGLESSLEKANQKVEELTEREAFHQAIVKQLDQSGTADNDVVDGTPGQPTQSELDATLAAYEPETVADGDEPADESYDEAEAQAVPVGVRRRVKI